MNFKDMRVETLSNNQVVITTPEGTAFFSYGTLIASKSKGVVHLTNKWDYSNTTSKYRNKFLGETTKETRAKLESGEYKAW